MPYVSAAPRLRRHMLCKVDMKRGNGKRRESLLPRSHHRPQRVRWKRPLSPYLVLQLEKLRQERPKAFTTVTEPSDIF